MIIICMIIKYRVEKIFKIWYNINHKQLKDFNGLRFIFEMERKYGFMVKKVGTAVYAHKSNLEEFFDNIKIDGEMFEILSEKGRILDLLFENISNNTPFEVIKYDKGNLSLIECDTWNTLQEPIVGDAHLFKKDGTRKLIKGNKMVYHSKEMFVNDNYDGFDVEKAKGRTLAWNKIPNIKKLKSKIGQIEYWHNLLKENNMEV